MGNGRFQRGHQASDEAKARRRLTIRAKAIGYVGIVHMGNKSYRRITTAEGRELEHRVVAERLLGRKLLPGEHVHHINGDGLDNRPENLTVLAQGDHMRLHLRLPEGKWSRKYDCCAMCGGTERKHYARGLCDPCYQRDIRLRRDRRESSGSSGPQA